MALSRSGDSTGNKLDTASLSSTTTLSSNGQNGFFKEINKNSDHAQPAKTKAENMCTFLKWSNCSDEEKKSDAYRAYAKNELAEAKIDIETIQDENIKLLILNNFNGALRLAAFFSSYQMNNWLEEFLEFPYAQLKPWIIHGRYLDELTKALAETGYTNIYILLKNLSRTNPEYFNALLSGGRHLKEFLITLRSHGHSDPLQKLLSIEVEKLSDIIGWHLSSIPILKCLKELEYKDPIGSLANSDQTKLKKFFSDQRSCIAFLRFFKNSMRHPDSLSHLIAFDSDMIETLFDEGIRGTRLMELFLQYQYRTEASPVESLLALGNAIRVLFYTHHQALAAICEALKNETREKDPFSLLISLGVEALIMIFYKSYQYECEINNGLKLEDKFKPVVTVNNGFRISLTQFLQQMTERKENNNEALLRLSINADCVNEIKDAKTHQIANIPVMLDGDVFDLQTLVSLKEDSVGYRKHPLTNAPFLLRDIQPDKVIQQLFDERVKQEADKLNKTSIMGCRR